MSKRHPTCQMNHSMKNKFLKEKCKSFQSWGEISGFWAEKIFRVSKTEFCVTGKRFWKRQFSWKKNITHFALRAKNFRIFYKNISAGLSKLNSTYLKKNILRKKIVLEKFLTSKLISEFEQEDVESFPVLKPNCVFRVQKNILRKKKLLKTSYLLNFFFQN